MPTPATAKWPIPKSEDEWEDMALDALKMRWSDRDACRNGRRGQRQNGVDIFGKPKGLAGYAGAQCKNTPRPTIEQFEAEISRAEEFRPALAVFYLVVTSPRDSELQEQVRLLSEVRTAMDKFALFVLFYEDVCQDIAARSDLITKHWSGWGTIGESSDEILARTTHSWEPGYRAIVDCSETLVEMWGFNHGPNPVFLLMFDATSPPGNGAIPTLAPLVVGGCSSFDFRPLGGIKFKNGIVVVPSQTAETLTYGPVGTRRVTITLRYRQGHAR